MGLQSGCQWKQPSSEGLPGLEDLLLRRLTHLAVAGGLGPYHVGLPLGWLECPHDHDVAAGFPAKAVRGKLLFGPGL